MTLLYMSAAAMALTAIAHSAFGEKRLIVPLLAQPSEVLSGYRPKLVRFAWHYTSVLMLLTAALVAWPDTPVALIRLTGAAWLLAGVLDALYTRFKHVGWPLLSVSGLLAIAGTCP
ncbi:hypothetical protein [Novosphingobium sp. B 225]|uniref:hypothetical protein n=1 Tax=Novosphingobium sp. B 225 TaxID=1961849 RepID=UPI000B4AFC3F|nr:hypothetical protein [Novosphingobium sp. B 225]